jgi:hypothetical protein
MSETIEYPGDAPTGPQTAVRPESPYSQVPQGYAYPPMGQAPPPPAHNTPNRLNKVAAWVGIIAGSLVIIAVLFGSGFYFGRETAPRPVDRSATGTDQGGPMIFPLPRGQFERPGPGIVIPNLPNGPTFQLPNIFPQFPLQPQSPTTQSPGEPPR